MKTTATRKPYRHPVAYPGAATNRQLLNRFLNGLMVLLSGAGVAAMIMFMLVFL